MPMKNVKSDLYKYGYRLNQSCYKKTLLPNIVIKMIEREYIKQLQIITGVYMQLNKNNIPLNECFIPYSKLFILYYFLIFAKVYLD